MGLPRARIVYRKYDGTLHWNQWGWLLGEDEYGVWVGGPAGTPIRRGHEVRLPAEAHHVALLPRDAYWTAMFNHEPHRTEIYCDVSTVPVWAASDEVTMVDLDLDVRRRRTGEVELLDEDEFALHRTAYGYPPDVVAHARAAAGWLVEALTVSVEPFATEYRHWLSLAAQAEPVAPPTIGSD